MTEMKGKGRAMRWWCFSIVCVAGFLLAAGDFWAQSPPSTAEVAADIAADIARLEKMLTKTPNDPVILYNLAADYAERRDRAKTLSLLRRVAALPGGLDPAQYRGFAFLREDAEFTDLVAGIRRQNPSIVHSTPAFTLKERDLFPEGMAYDAASHRLYAGSVKRKIVWTDGSGATQDLVSPGQDGIAFVLGLHIDAKRRRLWAVSSALPGIDTNPKPKTGLFEYDLDRRTLIRTFPLPSDARGFLNDVVVSAAGEAYTTNTSSGAIYLAHGEDAGLQEFLPPGSVPGANGIALSDDGRVLFVAGDFGIYRVDLKTRSVHPLTKSDPSIIDASIDGLYWYRESLVGIQNGIHPGRIVRFYLNRGLSRIKRSEILETYNPLFENPTTGSLDGDSLLFFANTQLHRFEFGKPLPPAEGLHELTVLRLPLS
jgi:hypothetical protein